MRGTPACGGGLPMELLAVFFCSTGRIFCVKKNVAASRSFRSARNKKRFSFGGAKDDSFAGGPLWSAKKNR